MLVEFDDVGCGLDVVFGEEDVLGEAGVGAVGFGEDDDCGDVSIHVGGEKGKGRRKRKGDATH